MTHHRGSRYILDPRPHLSPIDGNKAARIWHKVQAAERSERCERQGPGKRPRVHFADLSVLHALLFRFRNRVTGMCCPSVETIADQCGLGVRAVAYAIKRLKRRGFLSVVRRICKNRRGQTVQATSLYAFAEPSAMNAVNLNIGWPTIPFPVPQIEAMQLGRWLDGLPRGKLGLCYQSIFENVHTNTR